MSDLETIIRAAFRADPRVHSMSFGVCTMHRSPGNFANLRDIDCNMLYIAEAPDAIDAIRAVCAKATRKPEPVATMPGMITR